MRWRVVWITLAVVVALAVGVEFGLRWYVQGRVERAVESTAFAVQDPVVNLGGGSALLALTQGRFVDVSGTAASAQLPFRGQRVPVSQIAYQASDIQVTGPSSAVIRTVTASGTLSYEALSQVAGLPVAYGEQGRVLVTYQVTLLGENVADVGISGVPVLDVATQQVTLQQAHIDVAGFTVTESISQEIIDRVVKPISVASGERVRVTAITVTPDGVVAAASVTDLAVES